jgi:hypothetical protein
MRADGPALVLAKRSKHKLRYKLNVECRLAAADIGVRLRGSYCVFSHFASPVQNGCVIYWSDVSSSDYAPACLSFRSPLQFIFQSRKRVTLITATAASVTDALSPPPMKLVSLPFSIQLQSPMEFLNSAVTLSRIPLLFMT